MFPQATLAVGPRAKEGKGGGGPFDSPHFLLSSGSFNMALSRANCALKENACTAGYMATLCCAKNRRCKSSCVTSPLRDQRRLSQNCI